MKINVQRAHAYTLFEKSIFVLDGSLSKNVPETNVGLDLDYE